MRIRFGTLAALVVFGYCGPVYAACMRGDFGDFGVAELGDPVSRLPKQAEHYPDCQKVGEPADGICELYEWQGVGYEVVDGVIGAKHLFAGESAGNTTLPFGLSPNDTAADVIRKVAAHKGAPTRSSIAYDEMYGPGDHISVGPEGRCLKNARNRMYNITFTFGLDHKLLGIEISPPDNDNEND